MKAFEKINSLKAVIYNSNENINLKAKHCGAVFIINQMLEGNKYLSIPFFISVYGKKCLCNTDSNMIDG